MGKLNLNVNSKLEVRVVVSYSDVDRHVGHIKRKTTRKQSLLYALRSYVPFEQTVAKAASDSSPAMTSSTLTSFFLSSSFVVFSLLPFVR